MDYKQHLSRLWNSIHGKVKQHWGWVTLTKKSWRVEKKVVLIKKAWIVYHFVRESIIAETN